MKNEFGIIIQHGYVVPSIDAVIPKWTALGVGPFFGGPAVSLDNYVYRGKAGKCQVRVAIAYWGDLQIELIEPAGDDTTMYSDWIKDGGAPLNHYGVIVPSVKDLIKRHKLGSQIVQQGDTIGGDFAYVEGVLPDGFLLELIEHTDLIKMSSAGMKAAAQTWDGSRPVRNGAELFEGMAKP